MLFTGLLLHFSRVGFVQSAPIQNITDLQTEIAPAWVEDPSGRGTWQLLYRCGLLGIYRNADIDFLKLSLHHRSLRVDCYPHECPSSR